MYFLRGIGKLSPLRSGAKNIFLLCWVTAILAQSAERIHGKDEVNSSILLDGSNKNTGFQVKQTARPYGHAQGSHMIMYKAKHLLYCFRS